jgi:low affinity Fe/Cu permease
MKLSKLFTPFANFVSHWAGRPATFIVCLAAVVAWAASGPMFKFSDTWQLVINTSTTIVTFLMVFLIQNTQNRDNLAVQVKLDELIRAGRAPNRFIGVEHLTDEELEALVAECEEEAKGRTDGEMGLIERAARGQLSGKHARLSAARTSKPKAKARAKPRSKAKATA